MTTDGARLNETLIRIVAETIAFLDLSGDEAIHPDVAVRQLESIAAELRELSSDKRDELFGFVSDTLVPEELAAGHSKRADLYAGMRSSLGL